MTRQYIVTVSGSEDTNYASAVRTALEGGLPFSLYVDDVAAYDPENTVRLPGKITAIKRIRALLGTSLVDSKFLTDTAVALGSAQWGHVKVTYHGSDGTFTVADNRP
jgi:hypothetical protein